MGIALAYVIQKSIKNSILLILLRNKIDIKLDTFGIFLKIIAATIVFSGMVYMAKQSTESFSDNCLILRLGVMGVYS